MKVLRDHHLALLVLCCIALLACAGCQPEKVTPNPRPEPTIYRNTCSGCGTVWEGETDSEIDDCPNCVMSEECFEIMKVAIRFDRSNDDAEREKLMKQVVDHCETCEKCRKQFFKEPSSEFKGMTDAELKAIADREPVAVIGLTGIVVEKTKRMRSEEAKAELRRRELESSR